MIRSDDVILFQGDSITDAGRNKTDNTPNSFEALGRGYAYLAAASLLADHPDQLRIFNRGISGNRVTDLAGRWQDDAIALRPTLVSILIGVNDTWHGTAKGTPENGVAVDRYEQVYRHLLADTTRALPGVRLVLCEPFTTKAGAVLELNFFPEIDQRREVVRRLAKECGATFVPFQDAFDQACRTAPPAYWAGDGVHPSIAGHKLMARTWLNAVQV